MSQDGGVCHNSWSGHGQIKRWQEGMQPEPCEIAKLGLSAYLTALIFNPAASQVGGITDSGPLSANCSTFVREQATPHKPPPTVLVNIDACFKFPGLKILLLLTVQQIDSTEKNPSLIVFRKNYVRE